MKRMYKNFFLFSILLILLLCTNTLSACQNNITTKKTEEDKQPTTSVKTEKARTVITTDGEVDDMNSVIRFLLYSNEVDLSGIVLTSSKFHYAGDDKAGIKPYRWTGTEWIQEFINGYEKIYPNLNVHADGYPKPEYLKNITKIGNIKNAGEMEEITEGSELLKKLFLDDDDRKLYVQTWGGTNTTARALKSIEDQYKNTAEWESIQKKLNNKLVLYIILNQDDSYNDYISQKWPNIQIINDASNFWRFAYAWKMNPSQVNNSLQGDWLYKNIKSDHGDLLSKYALIGDGNYIKGELEEEQRGTDSYLQKNSQYKKYDFISEGDSPSFLYLINNGLRSLENPSYGGWGGRFETINDKLSKNTSLDYDPYTNQYEAEYSLMRWFDDIQNDFAARADWAIKTTYKEANHNPILSIKEGIDLTASPGEKITLHAEASDPDDDSLTYKWWHYAEADTYEESKVSKNSIEETKDQDYLFSIYRKLAKDEVVDNITLDESNTDSTTFTIPKDAKSGDTIHIIAEVKDSGNFNLKNYQRVIITVK
ncbi:DUF1593 domain-containing protein [Clostridium sp. SHJSY1]|uniref:DUF1593 domain-containing protein n=1 Tax=Clostridium sp. SHJSY1 TaxID=2942483 RepID=UPI0028744F19|nr:nucleoside hydrolase-like domain-containing protein [Clostridium sp. SHJSY1]MDS0527349.1 DUF1593 domain-containing protein [Clostridium sp. SHJSY1]